MEAVQDIQKGVMETFYVADYIQPAQSVEAELPSRPVIGILNAIGFALPLWSGIIYLLVKLID